MRGDFSKMAIMRIRYRLRSQFFHELGQLLRSGEGVAGSLEVLGRGRTGGGLARVIAEELARGSSLSQAFRVVGFPEEDCAILDAGAETGRLEEICARLSEYYARMADARAAVLSRSLYPVVVLHLAIILLAIPTALLTGGNAWISSFLALGAFYGATVLVFAGTASLSQALKRHASVCVGVLRVPGLGLWFRTRSNARFARVFSLFVRSGTGVLRGLATAGNSSGSALIAQSAREIVEAVRGGSSLGDAVTGRPGLADEIERAIRVGDHSGRLDEESLRAAETLENRFLALLSLLAEWLPRILYAVMVFYVGWRIISTALQIGDAMGNLLEP